MPAPDDYLAPLPTVADVNGRRRLVEPNDLEREAAWRLSREAGQRATIANALAQAREGATLPGHRVPIATTYRVPGYAWRDHDGPTLEAEARARLRRAWATELHNHGRRPVGWPPIEVRGYAFPTGYAAAGVEWREVDLDVADEIRLSITGDTVPDTDTR